MENKTWAERFFQEKVIMYKEFLVQHNGKIHLIDNEFVIEIIKGIRGPELEQVNSILIKIDFANGDMNHFLEYLANGYIKTHF